MKVKISLHIFVMYCFYDLEKPGNFAFPNGIVGDIGTEQFKSHKTGPFTEKKTGRTGSASRPHIWECNLTVSHFCFLPFKCFSIKSLMASVTNLTVFYVLDSGYISMIFLASVFCFLKRSKPGSSLFESESGILLLDSLYAEDIKAVNSRENLSASSP